MALDDCLTEARSDRLVAAVLEANDCADLDRLIVAVRRVKAAVPSLLAWCSIVEAGWYLVHGRGDDALETLKLAQQAGAWWSERMLHDPDLETLWDIPDAADFASSNVQSLSTLAVPAPSHRIMRYEAPIPDVNVVVLHGNAPAPVDGFDPYWEQVARTIVHLRSSQFACAGAADWFDIERAHLDIAWCLEQLEGPIVMAGLGAGGQLAIECEWRHPEHAIIGSIAISPSCHRIMPSAEAGCDWRGQRPTRIHAGGKHGNLGRLEKLAQMVQAAGVQTLLSNDPGAGAAYPANANRLLRRDASWLVGLMAS